MKHKITAFFLENKTLRQTVVKNTFWMTVSYTFSRVLRAFLIIYAARVLGVVEFGIFSYAFAIAGFFSIFSDIGLTPMLTREVARKSLLVRQQYITTGLVLKLAFIALGSGLFLTLGPFVAKEVAVKEFLPMIVFLFIFDSFIDFFSGILRSLEKMELETFGNFVKEISILILGMAALYFYGTAASLVFVMSIGTGFGFCIFVWSLRSYFFKIQEFYIPRLVREILSQAWSFSLLNLLNIILFSTDLIMVGWLKNAESVGWYSAAQRIIILLFIIPGFLAASMFPSFSRFAGKEHDRLRSIFEKALRASLLIGIPIIVGGIFLAPQLILFLYGEAYREAVLPFKILILTVFFVFPNIFLQNMILAHNKQKNAVMALIFGTLGNVIFNAILIPPWNVSGAALATFGAQMIVVSLNFGSVKAILQFKVFSYLVRMFVPVSIMFAATFLFSLIGMHVVLNILFSGAIYFAMLVVFKEPLLQYITLRS